MPLPTELAEVGAPVYGLAVRSGNKFSSDAPTATYATYAYPTPLNFAPFIWSGPTARALQFRAVTSLRAAVTSNPTSAKCYRYPPSYTGRRGCAGS